MLYTNSSHIIEKGLKFFLSYKKKPGIYFPHEFFPVIPDLEPEAYEKMTYNCIRISMCIFLLSQLFKMLYGAIEEKESGLPLEHAFRDKCININKLKGTEIHKST